ncbi:MAG TPA: EAL domain-containing protein [Rhodocyclaceae bacterium]|nr:EAL domain-containing protein [Rhodocyclaceae bacterium]
MPISISPFSIRSIRSRSTWRWLRVALLGTSFIVLVLIWGFTLHGVQRQKQLSLLNARAAQNNLSTVVAENLRQLLQDGQAYASNAADWQTRGIAQTGLNLGAQRRGDVVYNRLALFDLQGNMLYATSPSNDKQSITRFIRQQSLDEKATKPALLIAPQSPLYSQSWQVPLLFPVLTPQGRLSALLEADFDLGYLRHLYQSLDIGESGDIRIVTDAGLELARASYSGLQIAYSGPESSIPMISISHPVPDYPLSISVNQGMDDVLTGFNVGKHEQISSMLLLSAMIIGITLWASHLLYQLRAYFDDLLDSETEKQRLIEQLEGEKKRAYELAAHDHLTGLLNRRMFTEMAASHMAGARRNRHSNAILFIDLDRFKSVNDTLGHNVGDRLLQGVAHRLRDTLRESDVIARFGGDEFVLMLTTIENEADIEVIAGKLVQVLSQPYTNLDGHTVQTSPSIGIAIYPRDGSSIETLLLNADAAMYRAKNNGPGNYAFFDASIKNNSPLEFELEQRLPSAISDHELILHYQPKVELQSFRITGFEALIRWQHPQHGMIFPNTFIPIAEASGHIVNICNWVIEAACRQLNQWQAAGLTLLPVAINLSGKQLHDRKLADNIVNTLARYNVPAELLEIEVTESSLVENIEIAGAILDELVNAGIKISLDDFGTGFSSLGYIRTLPINTIKIDRAFIRDITNSHDDAVIATSTITLAHNLGMNVVAEGIETRDQLIHLKTAGCDEGQGYLFSRPVSADAACLLLQDLTRAMA